MPVLWKIDPIRIAVQTCMLQVQFCTLLSFIWRYIFTNHRLCAGGVATRVGSFITATQQYYKISGMDSSVHDAIGKIV